MLQVCIYNIRYPIFRKALPSFIRVLQVLTVVNWCELLFRFFFLGRLQTRDFKNNPSRLPFTSCTFFLVLFLPHTPHFNNPSSCAVVLSVLSSRETEEAIQISILETMNNLNGRFRHGPSGSTGNRIDDSGFCPCTRKVHWLERLSI